MTEEMNVQVAINHYKAHLLCVKKYTEANRDKINERNRANYAKMKADPEKHERHKEKKRISYKLNQEKLVKKLLKELEEIKEN